MDLSFLTQLVRQCDVTMVAQRNKGETMATAANAATMTQAGTSEMFATEESRDLLRKTNTSELVIALCGPIGSPLHDVADCIKFTLLDKFNYQECRSIRLSKFIEDHTNKPNSPIKIPTTPGFSRVTALIDAGDIMRDKFGASILADLAIAEIRLDREKNAKSSDGVNYLPRRICHIIDSIKNQAELDLLREVYREVLYVVGVFSPQDARENSLKSSGLPADEMHILMERDAAGESPHGQTVNSTFPQSDFFLRMDTDSTAELNTRVERFLKLILGTEIITPTADESAMYAAASAATSSACLSRQVGAAVTDKAGSVLAVGWNDVPRAFGGLYQSTRLGDASVRDMRCYNKSGGICFNDSEKDKLAQHIVKTLGDLIPSNKRADAEKAIGGDKKIKGLIEFSRAIHAEMHAILNAMKSSGDRIHLGSIYVTTYPCHSCARHIIAAGIANVYYIEPYKKSLATSLHGDDITEIESKEGLVRILPYEGVAPTRYLSLFQMKPDSRKNKGAVIKISPKTATPRSEKSLQSVPALENIVMKSLEAKGLLTLTVEKYATPNDGPPQAA